MAFFSNRPIYARSDTEDERPVEPEWFGPPRGVLPGYMPERAVVFRTDDAILLAGRFDVYRTGVDLAIELQLRADDDDLVEVPWELHRRRPQRGDLIPDEFLSSGSCSPMVRVGATSTPPSPRSTSSRRVRS